MYLYVLDNQLRRVALYDSYISLIWTERYNEAGEFQLTTFMSRDAVNLFGLGVAVALSESTAVMFVRTQEVVDDDDSGVVLKITGVSMEAILQDRYAIPSLEGSDTLDKWTLEGLPAEIARQLFSDICVDLPFGPTDAIPFYTPGVAGPVGNIPEPSDPIPYEVSRGTLYEAIAKLCQIYHMGFRFVRPDDSSKVYFEIYMGSTRTTTQGLLPPVVFSRKLDTLGDISELRSLANHSNVAFVVGSEEVVTVYADGVDETISGFERKVLYVDASDIDMPAGAARTAALRQKGKEALAEHRPVIALDGEVPENSGYKYNRDYFLGDMVEMTNSDGVSTNLRVTEQIFSSDVEGDKSFPTLTFDLLITPGSWLAWNALQVWDDAVGMWNDA